MYEISADLYNALYHLKDYAGEAERIRTWVGRYHPRARTLLDVGCGTGLHLAHLRGHFDAQGLDSNASLLDGARRQCPDVRFHQADMRDFELADRFDVVTCLFSSVGYLPDTSSLDRSIAAMARHLAPGGLLIVEPWFTPHTYWTDRLTVNLLDHHEYKGAWMYFSRREENRSILDIHYLVGSSAGIEQFVERHELTLFLPDEMARAFAAAGLFVLYDSSGLSGRGLYLSQKTALVDRNQVESVHNNDSQLG